MAAPATRTVDVAPLESVIITQELDIRATRPPNHAAVNRALIAMAGVMANSPDHLLQHLVDTALNLCQAGSAGISILEEEDGRQVFRWHALAGEYAPHIFGTTPREFSPCGTVLDRDAVQLMSGLDRHFGYFADIEPRIEEALLIPFHVSGRAVGTIWVVAHDQGRRFDREDVTILSALAGFSAAAYQALAPQRDLARTHEALRQAHRKLQRVNADLEVFAFAASHELQEPLRTATTIAQLLHGQMHDKLDTRSENLFCLIAEGLNRMKHLIDDLLEYSRVGPENAGPFVQTNLDDVLTGVIANLQQTIQDQGATITADPLPTLHGNGSQLSLLLQNLIVNAIKYRKADPPQIHLSAERGASHWIVRVRDNGEGFSKLQGEAIFGIFKRLHGKDIPGTGMGLALCEKIVQNHGGTIRAASVPGEGSTFTFTIKNQ